MNHKTLLLSRQDVKSCLDMSKCLEIIEQVFRAHGEGEVVMPAKLGLNLGEFLDFVLGWTTIDIFGDDNKRKGIEPAAPADAGRPRHSRTALAESIR